MGKDEFSKAEQYRRERKERLAKEAKKNSKRNAAVAKAKTTALKVCAIVVAAAIVFGIVVAAFNAAGSSVFRSKVATVGSNKISSVEFSYYYRTVYNFYYQYASQGYDLGFDASIAPVEQKYTADDEPTTAAAEDTTDENGETTKETTTKLYDTWDDFFIDATLTQIKNNYMLNAAAEKEGIKLDDKEIKEVDDQIETMKSTAKSNGYTLNAYIKATYGSGLNAKFLREFMLKDALTQKYMEYKQDEIAASYDNEKVLEEFNNNKNDYTYVDYRTQTFSVSDDQDAAATKKLADEFLAKATSSAAFEAASDEIAIADSIESAKKDAESSEDAEPVDEDSIKKEYKDADNTLKEKAAYSDVTSVNEELADWLFETAKSGATKVFTVKSDETVNVRHILFKFNEDQSTPTEEQKTSAKQKADDALKEWKSGDKTEDSFAAIAKEKSEDEGSASNGGLYEDVTKGQMVANFNDWIFDSSRKAGDTDIVETEYGYHVMYFVSKNASDVSSYIVAMCDKAPYKDETYTSDFRHIYFAFNSEKTDESTDEGKAAAKQKAEDALKEWESGDKTEDSFGEIAKAKSEDSSSSASGGLYEDAKIGQFVSTFTQKFEDWIFDSSRKAGDVEIIETENGYHVMYYVAKSDIPVWEATIRDKLASEEYQTQYNEMKDSSEYEIDENMTALKMISKKVNKSIKRYIYNVESNQAANSASAG